MELNNIKSLKAVFSTLKSLRFVMFALVLIISVSCTISYKFNGGNIDYTKTKSISIVDFANTAELVYAPLSQEFSEKLRDAYRKTTRLQLLKNLLAEDGSIWITLDDNESHYLKVMCDEIFGRNAFICSMVWENFYGRSNAAAVSPAHNYILVYSPMGQDWKKVRNLLPRNEESLSKYKNPDKDPRGPWRSGPIFASGERHEGLMYTITIPSGRKVAPPKGSHWRMTEENFWQMVNDGRILFGENGDNNPAVKLFLSDVEEMLHGIISADISVCSTPSTKVKVCS